MILPATPEEAEVQLGDPLARATLAQQASGHPVLKGLLKGIYRGLGHLKGSLKGSIGV